MGNFEVGYFNIGVGIVVYIGLSLINKVIKDGEFEKNFVFNEIFKDVKDKNIILYLIGLLSLGGVYLLEDYLFKLFEMAYNYGFKKVFVYFIGDGRDVVLKLIILLLEKL